MNAGNISPRNPAQKMFVLRAEKDGNNTGEAQKNGRKKFSSVCLFVCLPPFSLLL